MANYNSIDDAQEKLSQKAEILIKDLSKKEFLDLGMSHIAYIRPIRIDQGIAYAIHAADGTTLMVMESEDMAIGAIRHNEMSPVTLH